MKKVFCRVQFSNNNTGCVLKIKHDSNTAMDYFGPAVVALEVSDNLLEIPKLAHIH
jgi:hypothetical protein